MSSLPILSEGGDCGGCTACCTVLGVKELRKSDYTPCEHLCQQGCGVYDDRPKECQSYECLWFRSTPIPELRPDKLGVILELNHNDLGTSVVVREVWQGASDGELAQQFINGAAKAVQGFIYIVKPDQSRSVVLPPWSEHLRGKVHRMVYRRWEDEEEPEVEEMPDTSAQDKVRSEKFLRDKEARRRLKKLAKQSKKRNR